MKKLFSLLVMFAFAFSINIYADVGKIKTDNQTPTKSAAIMPNKPTVSLNSVAESRRSKQPILYQNSQINLEADFETTYTNNIFDKTTDSPPKRISLKRGKAIIRSPDAERTE